MISTSEEARKKHIRKQNIIAAVILAGGTMLSLVFFEFSRSSNPDVVPEIRADALVKTITLGQERTNTAVLEKTATFTSTNSANAIAEISGRIRDVTFNVGSYVEKGQVLAVFSLLEEQYQIISGSAFLFGRKFAIMGAKERVRNYIT